jgi:hypothetical protein
VGVGDIRIGHSEFAPDFENGDFNFGPLDTDLGENSGCET